MKKTLLTILLGSLWASLFSVYAQEDIPIDENHFPDANFRMFLFKETDFGADSIITTAEIPTITSLNVTHRRIQSLKGIELFPNLNTLYATKNWLQEVDLSKNVKIKELHVTDNRLIKLDLTALPELANLQCYNNFLTELDLSNNPKLNYLDCSVNRIQELDLSKNVLLTTIYCENNHLKKIITSSQAPLTVIYCYNNRLNNKGMTDFVNSLPEAKGNFKAFVPVDLTRAMEYNSCLPTDVVAAKGKGWRVLTFNGGWKNAKDYEGKEGGGVTKELAVDEVNFPDEKFRTFLLKNTPYGKDKVITAEEIKQISGLILKDMEIASLKGIEFFEDLQLLEVQNNKLETIDVTKNRRLADFNCSGNLLVALDVTTLTNLEKLFCYSNQLWGLDISNNPELDSADGSNNVLQFVDASHNPKLRVLYCENNKLTNLDLSSSKVLDMVYCFGNNINGKAMTELVKSLPEAKGEYKVFAPVDFSKEVENNLCTKADVKVAKEKGWRVIDHNGTYANAKDYEGGAKPTPNERIAADGLAVVVERSANPSIHIQNAKGIAKAILYAMDGQLLREVRIDVAGNAVMTLDELSGGVYLLAVGDATYKVIL